MDDDPKALRDQALEWRKAAKRHGGKVGESLSLAADVLDRKASQIQRQAATANDIGAPPSAARPSQRYAS